jgi:phosphatidylglycerophosphate synthase
LNWQLWIGGRSPILRSEDSRAFVDQVLGELADGRWRPGAWGRFLARSLERSWQQAQARPAAAAELTAIHLVAAAARPGPWLPATWFLAITHLGLLGEQTSLGWPNRLSLFRAMLPGLFPPSRLTALVAIATDIADGRLARRAGPTAFGSYADPMADMAFWTWFAVWREPSPWLRRLPIALWWLPAAAITVTYFAGAKSVDYPRPHALRHASGFIQALLTLRAFAGPSAKRKPVRSC